MMRNPVFESSMKRQMRSVRAPLLVTLYVAFLMVVSVTAIATLQRDAVTLGSLRAGLETYIYVSVMQFLLIILVAPALTAGAISGERERQTLDLLLCTRVGALRIALGKLLSNTCFLWLMIVSSLPVMALTLFFGGVSLIDMLIMELFLMICALACCSIGIFCSAVFKRTVTATVVAYLAIFAIGIGTLAVPLLFQMGQLRTLSEIAMGLSNNASFVYIGGMQVDAATVTMPRVPALLYANPAIALASMLLSQTGLLRNTMNSYMGYQGDQLFSILEAMGSTATINMIVMAVASVVLALSSALFVKPAGLKAKKRG